MGYQRAQSNRITEYTKGWSLENLVAIWEGIKKDPRNPKFKPLYYDSADAAFGRPYIATKLQWMDNFLEHVPGNTLAVCKFIFPFFCIVLPSILILFFF